MRSAAYIKCLSHAVLILHLNMPAYAAKTEQNLFDLSLDELVNIEIDTAGKTTEKIKDIPANVSIVTRDDITKYGYSTLVEVLENVPGLYNIDNYYFSPGNFGTRGLWNPRSQNASFAILVNGVNQARLDVRSNLFEKITVPVESIDRIEFIRGPMSVMYGNGASFGVINIVTNESDEKVAAFSSGSKDTNKVSLRTVLQQADFKITLDLAKYHTDGYDYKYADMSEGAELTGQLAFLSSPDFTTKDRLEHDNDYIHLAGSYENFYFDLSRSTTDSEFYILVPATDEGTLKKSRTNTFQIGYKSNVSDSLNIDLKGTYSEYDYATDFEGITPGKIGFNSLEYRSYELELITDYQANSKLNLVTGLYYQEMFDYEQFTNIPVTGVNNEYFFLGDRITRSIYTQATYQLSQVTKLYFGYRYEELPEYQSSGYNPGGSFASLRGDIINRTPRVAAVFDLNKRHTLKAMYGEASRISDDKFNPEVIKTYELNHIYKGNNFVSNTSIFHSYLNNLLVRERNISGNFPQQPVGEIVTSGVESIIHASFTEKLSGEFGMTYQSSKDSNNPGIEVAYSPEIVLHGKLAYMFSDSVIAVTSRYVSSMEPFYDFSNSSRIGNKIDGYIVFDLNYRVNNLFADIYMNFRVSNIFDEEIRYPNNPENNGTGGNAMNKGTLGQEREFMLTLGTRF